MVEGGGRGGGGCGCGYGGGVFFPSRTIGSDTIVRSLLCMVMSLDWESPTLTERIKLCTVTMNDGSKYL